MKVLMIPELIIIIYQEEISKTKRQHGKLTNNFSPLTLNDIFMYFKNSFGFFNVKYNDYFGKCPNCVLR